MIAFEENFQPSFRPAWRAPGSVRSGGGLLPWANYRVTTGLLAEYAFSEGSGRAVADNSGNGKSINLDLPTTPNDTWTAQGITLAAGLIQTPSLTGVRTVVQLIRVPRDQTENFVLSGGSSSGNGVIPGGFSSSMTLWTGMSRGVVPMYARQATGQAGYRLSTGGWYLLFTQFDAQYTTALGFGGRHSTTTSRCVAFDIAYATVYNRTLTDDDRSKLYLLCRSLLKDRGAYLDWRDAPVQGDIIAIWGQSNAEGRAKIATLSAPDQARTSPANVFINHRNNRVAGALVMGSNQQAAAPMTDFGPEMGLAWAFEDSAATGKLYISTYGLGSTFLANTASASDWNLADLETSNLFNAALRTVWQAEAQMLNAGIGPRLRGIFWLQGEQDATNATYGSAYQANLEALIAKAREQLGDNTARFLIARIRDQDPAFNGDAVASVRLAQATVGGQTNNAWVDTDDLSLAMDNVHYAAAGMKTLGQRVYANLFP